MDSFVRGTIKTAIYGTKAPPTAELHGHISYTQSEDHAFSILKEKEKPHSTKFGSWKVIRR